MCKYAKNQYRILETQSGHEPRTGHEKTNTTALARLAHDNNMGMPIKTESERNDSKRSGTHTKHYPA